jgi:transposase-like protein
MTKTTESKWRALIAEQERSGLTAKEFAERRGITATTLYWWRCRLRRRRHPTELVPVEVVERDIVANPLGARAAVFDLELGDSLILRIPAGFDEAELRRLVRALRC